MKKYQEIFNDLKDKIMTKTYPAGSLLPTENELKNQYQVSRDTVRKALTLLTQKGLIQKRQGRGSMVLSQDLLHFPVSDLTSYKELTQALNRPSVTAVVSLELISIDSSLALLTGFEAHSKAWKIVRTRTLDGKVAVLDTDYLDHSLVPHMSNDIAADSIYDYLENQLKLDIAYAQKEITVEPASQEDRRLMASHDDYLVLVRSRVCLSDTRQFQYTESKHRIDKFKFVDFARRKHSL